MASEQRSSDVSPEGHSHEDNPGEITPASQPNDQGATQHAGANPGKNGETVAPVDPTPAGEDPRFAGLTRVHRFRLMELEAERQVLVEQLKLAQMQQARGLRREHSDDHYRESGRKKASMTKPPETQSLEEYNAAITFLEDCEDYFESPPRIDFTTDEEKVRWSLAFLVDKKKRNWRNSRNLERRHGHEPTWQEFAEWCLSQVRNPVIKSHDVGRQLA